MSVLKQGKRKIQDVIPHHAYDSELQPKMFLSNTGTLHCNHDHVIEKLHTLFHSLTPDSIRQAYEKSNRDVLKCMSELKETEKKISREKRRYRDSIESGDK